MTCWQCNCDKCGHNWITKNHALPLTCAKCKSIKWDAKADSISVSTPEPQPAYSQVNENYLQVSNEPELVGEWEGWSDEKEEYDGTTGETIIYRQKLVKPFNRQIIRREH